MSSIVPTTGNLMALRRSRMLAEGGRELMDKKRNILVRELMNRLERATELQTRIDEAFGAAYDALALAEIVSGSCAEEGRSVPVDESVRLRWRSVMGVDIPSVTGGDVDTGQLPYSLAASNSSLDEAYRRFREVKGLLAEIAETEIVVYRLAYAIKKSQKRVNALENIVIPEMDGDIARIEQALAEKEREEFVRQKVVKAGRGG